jgi:hypothetical protein
MLKVHAKAEMHKLDPASNKAKILGSARIRAQFEAVLVRSHENIRHISCSFSFLI